MNERRYKLIYHSLHGRPLRGGCMPVFLLLALLLLGGMLMMVRVEMPEPLTSAGEGSVIYRKDELLYAQIRQRSPLPMRLPDFVDPARHPEEGVNLPFRRELHMQAAPPESPFATAPDSVVLDAAGLLALPPTAEEKAAAKAAAEAAANAPAAAAGAEAQGKEAP